MRRRAGAALASIIFALSALGAGPAIARDDFRSGVWEGKAHPGDGGPFTHCTIVASYENGISLSFVLTRAYYFGLRLYNFAWSLREKDVYNVLIAIDGGHRQAVKATAVDSHGVLISLPGGRDTFERFKSGSALLVEAAGGRFRFDLGGTYAALNALLDCVNRNVRTAGAGGANPFGGSAAERPQQRTERPAPRSQEAARPPAQASPEARALAASFVEKLLLRAELYSYEILTGERVPARLRRFDVVWKGYHVIGVLQILPRGAYGDIEEAAGDTVQSHQQSCDGKLTSKGWAIRLDDKRTLVQLAVACAGKEPVYLDYTLVPLADGGFYRILHLSSADPDAGRAANERIGGALSLMLTGK